MRRMRNVDDRGARPHVNRGAGHGVRQTGEANAVTQVDMRNWGMNRQNATGLRQAEGMNNGALREKYRQSLYFPAVRVRRV